MKLGQYFFKKYEKGAINFKNYFKRKIAILQIL